MRRTGTGEVQAAPCSILHPEVVPLRGGSWLPWPNHKAAFLINGLGTQCVSSCVLNTSPALLLGEMTRERRQREQKVLQKNSVVFLSLYYLCPA